MPPDGDLKLINICTRRSACLLLFPGGFDRSARSDEGKQKDKRADDGQRDDNPDQGNGVLICGVWIAHGLRIQPEVVLNVTEMIAG